MVEYHRTDSWVVVIAVECIGVHLFGVGGSKAVINTIQMTIAIYIRVKGVWCPSGHGVGGYIRTLSTVVSVAALEFVKVIDAVCIGIWELWIRTEISFNGIIDAITVIIIVTGITEGISIKIDLVGIYIGNAIVI